jgi:hypothetical protein
MKLKQYLTEAHACPLAGSLFGEMPGGGGYEANTEYEIGAQRMAEAAHCILGSLSKYTTRDDKPLWVEKGHIKEEMNIIEEAMVEYSRYLYIDRLKEKIKEGNKYGELSVKSIIKASPKLKKKARSARTRLSKDLPKTVYDVAFATYNFIISLAEQMYDSVAYEPLTSAYRKPELIRSMNILRKAVKHLLSLPDDATVAYLKSKKL